MNRNHRGRRTFERPPTAVLIFLTVSNLLLAFVVASGVKLENLHDLLARPLANVTNSDLSVDPLALARLSRTEKYNARERMQESRKGPMAVTQIDMIPGSTDQSEHHVVDEQFPSTDELAVDENSEASQAEVSQDMSGQDGTGVRMEPIVRQDKSTGRALIGNFKAMTMNGDSEECLSTGYSMLNDAGISKRELSVMINSKQITIAKICATNGSIVLSCRTNQITVSPRRYRPDDGCRGKA